ncbi:MAG: hypothetical protein ACI9DK_003028 [Vicingaceae bacterium]|jgi:hypothetical protein
MIVPEYIIRDIILQMPLMTVFNDGIDRSINFGWGDKLELNRYLVGKKDGLYPLIWLLIPAEDTHSQNGTLCNRTCSFIIANTEERSQLYNPQRYEYNFKIVLLPVTEYIIHGIKSSNETRIENDEYKVTKHPNYSDEGSNGEESATIALWDAVRLDIDVEFIKTNCKNVIKWQ